MISVHLSALQAIMSAPWDVADDFHGTFVHQKRAHRWVIWLRSFNLNGS